LICEVSSAIISPKYKLGCRNSFSIDEISGPRFSYAGVLAPKSKAELRREIDAIISEIEEGRE